MTDSNDEMNIEEKILLGFVRVSELFKKKASALFKDYGLTFAQYNVLKILEASQSGQMPITSISKAMLVSGANMTGVAKRLEKGGFALRKGDAGDERVRLLEITPRGRKTLKKIKAEKEQHITNFLKNCSDNHKKLLLSNIRKILNPNIS